MLTDEFHVVFFSLNIIHVNKDKGGECGTYGGKESTYRDLVDKSEGQRALERLGVDGRLMLIWILKQQFASQLAIQSANLLTCRSVNHSGSYLFSQSFREQADDSASGSAANETCLIASQPTSQPFIYTVCETCHSSARRTVSQRGNRGSVSQTAQKQTKEKASVLMGLRRYGK